MNEFSSIFGMKLNIKKMIAFYSETTSKNFAAL